MRIVELEAEQKVSDKRFIWDGLSIAEERNASGTVVARFYAQGQVRPQSSTALYYTFDHLGSIREVVEGTGYSVVARYDYDPYGRRTRVDGNEDVEIGFTGHYYHAESGLWLAPFRAYDPETGRWISRDPIEEEGGRNLYSYVGNNPVGFVDRTGLFREIYQVPTIWDFPRLKPILIGYDFKEEFKYLIKEIRYYECNASEHTTEIINVKHLYYLAFLGVASGTWRTHDVRSEVGGDVGMAFNGKGLYVDSAFSPGSVTRQELLAGLMHELEHLYQFMYYFGGSLDLWLRYFEEGFDVNKDPLEILAYDVTFAVATILATNEQIRRRKDSCP